MAHQEAEGSISETDAANFARKLDAWARDLTPAEQKLLQRLLTRAAAAGGDTEGHILAKGLAADRGIIIVGGRPSPLLLRSLNLSSLTLEGGGGIGRR